MEWKYFKNEHNFGETFLYRYTIKTEYLYINLQKYSFVNNEWYEPAEFSYIVFGDTDISKLEVFKIINNIKDKTND